MTCVYQPPYSRSRSARRGVTLLEVTLAMGLLVALSSMTYWFYGSVISTTRRGTSEANTVRLARVVLDRMSREIRQASAITADNRRGIRGEAERIWLSSYRVPTRELSEDRRSREEPPPGEYDLTKIEYGIVRHPEVEHPDGYEFPLGLKRIEVLVPRPDHTERDDLLDDESESEFDGEDGDGLPDGDGSGDGGDGDGSGDGGEKLDGEGFGLPEDKLPDEDQEDIDPSLALDIAFEELYAPEIRYLRFCYFDGSKWWDTWDVSGDSPLPQLVMVTIGYEPRPPFGQEFGLENKVNEEFCQCLTEEQLECEPLAPDQYSVVVRVPQADPLFRSRVTRETQGLMEGLSGDLEP